MFRNGMLVIVWQFIIMTKYLDFAPQSHKNQKYISGQIWQTAIEIHVLYIYTYRSYTAI